jgi:hypothetical protein
MTGLALVASGSGIVNPFAGQFAVNSVDDTASVDSNDSGASLFSLEEDRTTIHHFHGHSWCQQQQL